MTYLCDFYDPQHRLMPEDPLARSRVMQYLMFQMAGIGPMQVCAEAVCGLTECV
jgi:glutathione S-transferase